MTRWAQGEQTILRALGLGHLENVVGGEAEGNPWIVKAKKIARSARVLCEDDPETAYAVAYDAARHACIALLVQQGLRPTRAGGHYIIEEVTRAQFGDAFKTFGKLRRRRNELEYPSFPGELASPAEAREAISEVHKIIDATTRLLPHLQFFD